MEHRQQQMRVSPGNVGANMVPGWQSASAQRAYMQLFDDNILGVSRTIMTQGPNDHQVSDETNEDVEMEEAPHNPFHC